VKIVKRPQVHLNQPLAQSVVNISELKLYQNDRMARAKHVVRRMYATSVLGFNPGQKTLLKFQKPSFSA
jgi:hypothetical protein